MKPSLLDSIKQLSGALAQARLGVSNLISRIDGLANAVSDLTDQISAADDPKNYAAIAALEKDLRLAGQTRTGGAEAHPSVPSGHPAAWHERGRPPPLLVTVPRYRTSAASTRSSPALADPAGTQVFVCTSLQSRQPILVKHDHRRLTSALASRGNGDGSASGPEVYQDSFLGRRRNMV